MYFLYVNVYCTNSTEWLPNAVNKYIIPSCTHDVAGRQHRECIIPQAVTQSSVPEDGQNNCPKHVELFEIINKLLLLHLFGCLYYLYQTNIKFKNNVVVLYGSLTIWF